MFDDQSEIKEDEPPAVAAPQQEPFTKPGDRWLLGQHVLYCGDSTRAEDMAALLEGEKADLCITDPPYNVAYEGSNGKTIQNDNMPEEQFVSFLTAAFKQLQAALKPGAPFYIWHKRMQIAYAEAITQMLWMKGLITTKERNQINKKTGEKLGKGNC